MNYKKGRTEERNNFKVKGEYKKGRETSDSETTKRGMGKNAGEIAREESGCSYRSFFVGF
jgi:hypothetical protein